MEKDIKISNILKTIEIILLISMLITLIVFGYKLLNYVRMIEEDIYDASSAVVEVSEKFENLDAEAINKTVENLNQKIEDLDTKGLNESIQTISNASKDVENLKEKIDSDWTQMQQGINNIGENLSSSLGNMFKTKNK